MDKNNKLSTKSMVSIKDIIFIIIIFVFLAFILFPETEGFLNIIYDDYQWLLAIVWTAMTVYVGVYIGKLTSKNETEKNETREVLLTVFFALCFQGYLMSNLVSKEDRRHEEEWTEQNKTVYISSMDEIPSNIVDEINNKIQPELDDEVANWGFGEQGTVTYLGDYFWSQKDSDFIKNENATYGKVYEISFPSKTYYQYFEFSGFSNKTKCIDDLTYSSGPTQPMSAYTDFDILKSELCDKREPENDMTTDSVTWNVQHPSN